MKNKITTFLSFLVLLSSLIPLSGNVFASQNPNNVPSRNYEKAFVVDKQEFISDVEKYDFAFSGIATRWGKDFSDIKLFLRSGKSEGTLSDWSVIEPEGVQESNSENFGEVYNADQSLFFQYKIDFTPRDLGKNFQINFDIFDTSKQVGATNISSDNSDLGPKIISRAEWGANESYMTWKSEYGEVKAFVIHHTAGEEGAKVADQMSVVRNLYYGHAVSYGWGDLGYNYVIDVNGGIYEGRAGGGGVVAGHTLGYNNGTVGIVLIGDYNIRTPSPEQYDALTNLIAYKSFQYGINPSGTVYLKNKTISTIVGHRDLNATACPGDSLYGRISDIRSKVADKLKTYPEKKIGAQFVSSDSNVQLYGGDVTKVKVALKNTGNFPWYKGLNHGFDITAKSGNKIFATLEDFGRSVEPGETGNFILDVTAPTINEAVNQIFEPRIGGNIISGSSFNVNLNIVTPEYRGKVVDKSADQEIAVGKQATLWVDVKNVGLESWTSGDAIKLFTSDNRNSIFYTDGDWESKKSPGGFDGPNISPGATGRISFLITAPATAGQYNEKFVVRSGTKTLEGGNLLNVEWNITVNASGGQLINNNTTTPTPEPKVYSSKINAYTFSLLNQSPYLTLNPGEKKSVWLEIKNTGITNWYKDIFHLATIEDKESSFADSSWLSKNRIAMMTDKVAPGDTARFDFTVTAPQTAGLFKERFGLVAEGIGWTDDIGIFWNFTVAQMNGGTPTISTGSFDDFAYVNQSPYLTVNSGESQPLWLEVKNTGNQVWQRSGAVPVRLATNNPRDRISSFINTNRVLMDKDTVNPGENVRFTFNITAPSEAKVYKEYFTLVRDSVAWFKDIGIYWQVTVNPANAGQQDVNQTPNNSANNTVLVNVPAGVQTVKVSSSGPFIVVNSAESKLAEGGKGDTITAFYKDGKHYFSINSGDIKEASGWVRIVPWAVQTILTVDSYSDHPAWNSALNDNKFKGAIEVRYSVKNKKLWVIDDLNIEDYLTGVSEPLEAGPYEYIKAAVIAERSYVYNYIQSGGRWPDDGFTLKNSRLGNGDDQIYQGYGFTSRSTNIPKAVSDTAGQVVTYNGKPVITPYFTQDDGRTRSITEAWGSPQASYPWLVSVSDPYCSGKPMLGHGVGMSGLGARGMGAGGKKYDEILKYFYTGTSIGKIDTNRNVRVGIYFLEM